jgi:hypothetical protein
VATTNSLRSSLRGPPARSRPRPAASRRTPDGARSRPRFGAALPVGELRVPEGFGLETEVRILAPAEPTPGLLALNPTRAAPRPSLTLRRFAAPAPNAAAALERLLEPLGAVAPRFATVSSGLVRFADGREGPTRTVRFEALPGQAVHQWHAVRLDGPVLTHFVVTAVELDALEGPLRAIVESFHP